MSTEPDRVGRRLDRLVRERAGARCEYCRLPQEVILIRFQIDHIIARQHGGKSVLENLALACLRCNLNKGTNLASVDPDTNRLTPLFHPRRDEWSLNFSWQGARIHGLTPVGRATSTLLCFNDELRLRLREMLLDPPIG